MYFEKLATGVERIRSNDGYPARAHFKQDLRQRYGKASVNIAKSYGRCVEKQVRSSSTFAVNRQVLFPLVCAYDRR